MSDKESSRVETGALIAAVRARPALWDRSAAVYRQRQHKDAAWREVARLLHPHYDEMTRAQRKDFGTLICRKWANIRDSYKKYLRGSQRGAGSRPYVYAERLSFLDTMYGHGDDGDQPDWFNRVLVDLDTRQSDDSQQQAKPEYPRTSQGLDSEESVVSVLVNLIQREEDEDRAFFKSITPAVKSLSYGDKMKFRIQVMRLLEDLRSKGDQQPLPSKHSDSE